MKVFREEQSSTVDISDSERIHGGFYMELNPETQKEISIVVTAQNGESRTELLHINWIESDVQLQRLYPSQGGSFTQDYDRETQYYYLKKDDSDTITLNYQGSPNTTLDIYVERKKKKVFPMPIYIRSTLRLLFIMSSLKLRRRTAIRIPTQWP